MTDNAVIKATFADYKRLRSRKVAQLIFEVPLETLHDAVAQLGGEPSIHDGTWCAIATLSAETPSDKSGHLSVATTKPKRDFSELPRSQQAALACQREAFQRFLHEAFGAELSEDGAAAFVRHTFDVSSRSLLDSDEGAGQRWDRLYANFQLWLEDAA